MFYMIKIQDNDTANGYRQWSHNEKQLKLRYNKKQEINFFLI